MRDGPFAGARIETPRTLLRPFEDGDLSAFVDIASEEGILEFMPSSDRMTREQLAVTFAWLLECYETNALDRIRKFTLGVVLKQTNEIVGWCGLGPLEYDESETEIFFVIAHKHWGQGFATEAAQALLGYAFDVLGLRRVVAVADPLNQASIRVIGKLRMKPEGVVQGLGLAHCDYEGHARYSMEASDWAEVARGV